MVRSVVRRNALMQTPCEECCCGHAGNPHTKGITTIPDPPPAVHSRPALPVTPPVDPYTHSGLSPSQAATMAAWTREDAASRKLSSEQVVKIYDD